MKASAARNTTGKDVQPAPAVQVSTEPMLPLPVAQWVKESGSRLAVFVAADEPALASLAAVLPFFLPEHRILPLPAWDALPYARARPSRAVTGTRITALTWLAEAHDQPAVVLTTPEALCQRVPPPERLRERAVALATGDALDPEWLTATLEAFGYVFEERVDEPGEATIRPGVVDIHPAGGATPVRLELDEGRIAAIRSIDPVTQRTTGDAGPIRILPASEAFTVPGETGTQELASRLLPDGPLASLFDLTAGALFGVMQDIEQRIEDWFAIVQDSFSVAQDARLAGQHPPAPPDRLFLRESELRAALNRCHCTRFVIGQGQTEPALPAASAARRAAQCLEQGLAVVLCTPTAPERLRPIIARRLHLAEEAVTVLQRWRDAEVLPSGRIGVMQLPLQSSFELPRTAILAVRGGNRRVADAESLEHLAGELRVGDLVVEPERGLARLAGLAMEDQAGAACECLSLEFLAGQRLLLPALEAGRIWRYGAGSSVSPSRLDGAAWLERRIATEQAIETAAVELVAHLRARERTPAPVIEPNAAYQRFVRRMPFAPSADQTRAIRAVRDDLAAGRPMHRLVCGDVGFGKTEVALHAAALAALSGRQVAVVAPTTILARQHLETFRRRFRGFDLRIEPLLRGTRSTAGRSVLRAVQQGEVAILVGTHAMLGARFRDLGLVIIDEEQRFGEAQKKGLRNLQAGVHTLVMTATPLPRSLQTALLGLIDVSLLVEAPIPRLPVRSIVTPFNNAVVRASLLRESRRGGQSFVVCPRIQDIEPMKKRLQSLVPELSLTVVHGRMNGDALETAMMAFSDGDSDVLLATNIIEAGLDLPNANTILVWRPERFGLAQLHQLRGRVGRGRAQAAAYLLTDPDHPPSKSAQKRLERFAGLDSLGAGFAVSAADLDQRGAGDLLGEEQAGHMLLIGTERYGYVLRRALARARGEEIRADWMPDIALDLPAYVPAAFIPEADVRLEIYRRLARLESHAELEDVQEELADRFGALPQELEALLSLTRLRLLCRDAGIAAVHAGPAAVALTPVDRTVQDLLHLKGGRSTGDRVLLPIAEASPAVRLQRLMETLLRPQHANG